MHIRLTAATIGFTLILATTGSARNAGRFEFQHEPAPESEAQPSRASTFVTGMAALSMLFATAGAYHVSDTEATRDLSAQTSTAFATASSKHTWGNYLKRASWFIDGNRATSEAALEGSLRQGYAQELDRTSGERSRHARQAPDAWSATLSEITTDVGTLNHEARGALELGLARHSERTILGSVRRLLRGGYPPELRQAAETRGRLRALNEIADTLSGKHPVVDT